MSNSTSVFYEKIYADTPESGIGLVEASIQSSNINVCPVPNGKDPYTLANQMLENYDPRVSEGNIGCIDLTKSSHNSGRSKDNLWLFFGWEMEH